jgi:asparagine synthase (glutamine-hydrolysing)
MNSMASSGPARSLDAEKTLIFWDRAAGPPSTGPAAGLQPAGSPSPSCLWFRGFIANRRDLAAEAGLPASTRDVDLLRVLYGLHGREAAERIAGPCAWVLWDPERHCLIASRDRLGTQALYYRSEGRQIRIAGRVEALLGRSRPSLNARSAVAQILGEAPSPGETFYEGISALEPGGMLVATREGLETRLYWRAGPKPVLKLRDDRSYAEAFRETFSRVTAEYLPGEPLGFTLTGGLDSTTVAATVRAVSPGQELAAFTWVAPELPEADESRAAAAVAERLGCPTVAIPADQHWPLRTDPGLQPSPEGPLFNFYTDLWDATFRSVREHGIRTLFSGLSGDHLFGGNVFSYPDLLLTGRWRKLAAEIRTHLGYSRIGASGILRRMILGPLARSISAAPSPSAPVAWLAEPYRRLRPRPVAVPRSLLPGRRERLAVLRDPLLPPLASLITAQAAAHGIDFRHPLLDHRLFDFAAALPTPQTFSAGVRKVILRNAMRGLLPDETLDRRDKIYPEAIARRGLAERETAKVWAMMTDMKAAALGFVDEARLREEYRRYLAGETRSALFWHTLTLEAWLRRWIP